ncbi:unnamed protein product [Cuscuta epithymum]|uniref:Uncharacterized protein n=1 Tax=Cuscuta epithymum TaxID=186058 RepID=A0AAV0FZ38_9ASTE|nr:unnamed protein product [Cuscuta epithymum]
MKEEEIPPSTTPTDDVDSANDAVCFELVPPPTPPIVDNANDAASFEPAAPPSPVGGGFKKKKRSKSFSLLKAALNIFQEKPPSPANEKSKSLTKKKSGDWKAVVGSMRPLTLQDKSPTPSMSPSCSYENLSIMSSPSPSPSHMSCASGTMSRYASVGNLQELDAGSDPDEVFDDFAGDEMIDVKAEEFIQRFYQQMKLQQRQHHHHRHHHRHM